MVTKDNIPEFCDYSCPHAEFPPADSAGICRTMAAVQCLKLKRLVDKNTPCAYLASMTGQSCSLSPRGRKHK